MNFRRRFERRIGEPRLNLGTLADGRPYLAPFSAFDRHCLVVGPTGMGKTRFLQRFSLEVAEKHPDVAQVVISPKGAFAPNLRRECYRRGWRRRVTYVDFSERRRLPGLNIRPWGDDFLQAKIQREVLTRSMGIHDLSQTPLLARYSFAGIFAAIASRLTMREAAMVLEHDDRGIRQAVIERLPECSARLDLEKLEAVSKGQGQVGAARFFEERVGSTLNRLRLLTENPALRLMLGSQRSLNWQELLAAGQIVVINADQGESLDREDQRYLVMSLIADLARTCFSRSPDRRVRVCLTVDEVGWFANSILSDILDRGREYGLSLVGAAQYLSQFIDPTTQDRRLLDSFLTDTLVKIVFGGLPPGDAHLLSGVLHEHLLDADKRQLEVRTLRQLQHVVTARSSSRAISRGRATGIFRGRSWAEGTSETWSRTHSSGVASSHGTASLTGHGSGTSELAATSASHAVGPLGVNGGTETSGTMEGTSSLDSGFRAEGENDTESDVEVESEGLATSRSYVEAEGISRSAGVTRSMSRAVTEGPMVQPTEPFQELTSVTIEPLPTQLHRCSAAMVRQPKQHALLATGKESPVPFRVADVADPPLTERQALVLDLDMMDAHNFFNTPEEIEQEIAERQRALLRVSVIEVVNTQSAIERRRAARQRVNPLGDEEGGMASMPVPLRPRGPRGRSGAAILSVRCEGA